MDTDSQKKIWYWTKNGVRQGPATLDEMKTLIESGEVSKETSVWNGEGNWVSARKSALRGFFHESASSGAAAIPSGKVDNKYVWMVVLVPVVGMLAEIFMHRELIWVYLLLNVAILLFDEYKLKKSGYTMPGKWWIVLIPVYLWKRAELLDHPKNYVYAWVATFVLTIPLAGWINVSIVEDSACPLVTKILQKYDNDTECKLVTIETEAVKDFYLGKALLNTGDEVGVAIEKKGGDIILRIKDMP